MKLRMLGRAAMVVAIGLWAAGTAHASTVPFFDNFDADPLGLNTTLPGWTVSNGTIDVVGPGDPYGLTCASGRCVDTDGSTGDAGIVSTPFTLGPGNYTLGFALSGNQRDGQTNSLQYSLGSLVTGAVPLASNAPWQNYSFSFTVAAPTTTSLVFQEIGGPGLAINDNIGILLDNVSLTQDAPPAPASVPEPASMTLIGTGIAGFLARRRLRA